MGNRGSCCDLCQRVKTISFETDKFRSESGVCGHSPSCVHVLVICTPTKEEMWFQSLGREDPLEKKMATHSSILAWEIPWTEEPGTTVHGAAKRQIRLGD